MSTATVHPFAPPCQYPDDPLPPIFLGGSVNLLAGAPGVGKTALMAGLCRQFRDGLPIFGREPRKIAGLGVISADRSWQKSTRYWFEQVGFGDIPAYSLVDDLAFNPDKLINKRARIDILKWALDQLKLPPQSICVVDPLSIFLGGNLNDYDTCATYCMRMQRVARERQLTLLGLAHAGKQIADTKARYLRLQDRILGSAALFGYTDTQMYLASPEETGENFYTFLWQPHHAPKELFRLQRLDNGTFPTHGEQIELAESGMSGGTIDDATLLALFPADGTGLALKDLLIHLPTLTISRATLMRYLQRLTTEGQLQQPKRGLYSRPRPS